MSGEEAAKQADLKPSERINDRTEEIYDELMNICRARLEADFLQKFSRAMAEANWDDFLKSEEGAEAAEMTASTACLGAIVEEIDREAERRSAWEKRVEAFAREQGVEI